MAAAKLGGQGPLEFSLLHASLLAYPHEGMPSSERTKNRATARKMLSDIQDLVLTAHAAHQAETPHADELRARLRRIPEDTDTFVELAKLWQDENLEQAITAYQLCVSTRAGEGDYGSNFDDKAIRMAINLGALLSMQGNITAAVQTYETALTQLADQEGAEVEMLRTVLAHNLGRAFEEDGDAARGSQWYRDVLRQHPEHMECA